jgi:hypothetical protein
VAQRTRYRHFPPFVTTRTDRDNGGWFRDTSPEANFWHVFYRNRPRRVRDNQSEGIRPGFIDDHLDRHGARGAVKLRPGAWNTGRHDGSGFTQSISSSAQQRALTRLDEISQAIYAARRDAVGISVRDPDVYLLLKQAHWRVLRGRDHLQPFSGATPGCSAATTTRTRPPTSWIRQWRVSPDPA